jgi:phosphoserine aminotransferase
LHEFAAKNQTPETPNVLAIYLLACVTHDMLQRGITNIRREADYKATLVYQLLSRHTLMKPFVEEKAFQSKTVIVADCGDDIHKILPILDRKGIIAGEGYGKYRANHLRFANFPTHSKEQFELLVDTLEAIN